MRNYCVVPPFAGTPIAPNVLLLMDYSSSMQFPVDIHCSRGDISNFGATRGRTLTVRMRITATDGPVTRKEIADRGKVRKGTILIHHIMVISRPIPATGYLRAGLSPLPAHVQTI